MKSPVMTLGAARAVVAANDELSVLHRRGHGWVETHFAPALAKLASHDRTRRPAARGYALLGAIHDLNGTPRAALRAYERAVRLAPRTADHWHAIGCLHDNMGDWRRARQALCRARALAPRDEQAAADLERVEWAMFNPCPVLYEARNASWHAMEALARGHHQKALALLARSRTTRARQVLARIHAAKGNAAGALAAWRAIGDGSASVQLQHADWYYTFTSSLADEPGLWRLMLWKLRTKIESGPFHGSAALAELDVGPAKRFELYVRYELARTEGDVRALLSLAAKYPSWREPGEAALRADSQR
jgi:tetratricopeptide (TPR) repeat protein